MNNVEWALHMGLVIGAPVCLLIGSYIAMMLTLSISHYTIAKLLGWFAGAPLGLASGSVVATWLVPTWPEKVALFYCAGYGWLALWGFLFMVGNMDGWLANLMAQRRADRRSPGAAKGPAHGSYQNDVRLKNKGIFSSRR